VYTELDNSNEFRCTSIEYLAKEHVPILLPCFCLLLHFFAVVRRANAKRLSPWSANDIRGDIADDIHNNAPFYTLKKRPLPWPVMTSRGDIADDIYSDALFYTPKKTVYLTSKFLQLLRVKGVYKLQRLRSKSSSHYHHAFFQL
jgi:hypothetical protein